MELKFQLMQDQLQKQGGFNRTCMELKLRQRCKGRTLSSCFNRTFMELKSLRRAVNAVNKYRFNRTFMELK